MVFRYGLVVVRVDALVCFEVNILVHSCALRVVRVHEGSLYSLC